MAGRFAVVVAAHHGDLLAGDDTLLAHPRAEVDQLAALAAERAEGRLSRPLDGSLAGGALDGAGGHERQVQVVSVKRTSSVVWIGRVFASCQTRNRTLQR